MLVVAGVMLWMVWQAIQGYANLGDLAMFYAAFSQGQGLMRSLLEGLGGIYGNSLFLGDLFEFLALEPQVVDPAQPVSVPKKPGQESGVTPKVRRAGSQESGVSDQGPTIIPQPSSLSLQPSALGPAIRFEGVSFRYPGSSGTRTVLHDLDFAVAAGQVAAIVGPNGAGKSTLIKLLCRFYDPQAGRVEMDGVDLRELPLAGLRSRITILFQAPVTYNETAAENVAIGGPAPAACESPWRDRSRPEMAALSQARATFPQCLDVRDPPRHMKSVQVPLGAPFICQPQPLPHGRGFFCCEPFAKSSPNKNRLSVFSNHLLPTSATPKSRGCFVVAISTTGVSICPYTHLDKRARRQYDWPR